MNIYHITSIVKLVIGTMILVSSLRFIDPRVDPDSSIIITSVALILMLWGGCFYLYLFIMSFVSDKKYSYLASYAYKLSFITGLYAAFNRLLIGYGIWSWWILLCLTAIALVIAAIVLGLIVPPQNEE